MTTNAFGDVGALVELYRESKGDKRCHDLVTVGGTGVQTNREAIEFGVRFDAGGGDHSKRRYLAGHRLAHKQNAPWRPEMRFRG